MNRIIAGKTILLNTVTNCTFIASKLDEEVQTGTRENDKHIEWTGELSIPVVTDITVNIETLLEKINISAKPVTIKQDELRKIITESLKWCGVENDLNQSISNVFIKETDKKGKTYIIEGEPKVSRVFSVKRFICEVQQQETEKDTQEVADMLLQKLNN